MKSLVVLSILGSISISLNLKAAEEVVMKAEKATVITFPSQTHSTYKLLAAQSAAGEWETLQDGIIGTGGEVTIFYRSESDQKLFFKVETSDGPEGQRTLWSLANLTIMNKDLSGYDLEGNDLRGFKFDGSIFNGANLTAANFTEASFTGSKFHDAFLNSAILSRGHFFGADFSGADLRNASVEQANLTQALLIGADLEGVRIIGGSLIGASLLNANLKGVSFDGTALAGANFSGATLTSISLRAAGSKCEIAGLPHNRALQFVNFSGANLTGSDLSRNNAESMNLTGANIMGANFEGTALAGVSMNGRDLRSVFLRGISAGAAAWSGVNANGVDLSLAIFKVNANDASFEGANLEGVVAGTFLSQTALTNVNFRNANLRGANLEGIIFRDCDFTGADLSFAKVLAADFTGCVGFNAEQPGLEFGGWPQPQPPFPPRPTATILPDGSARNGTNPGTGLAPSTIPAKLRFVINDAGTNSATTFQFTGWNGADVWGEWPIAKGTFTYEARGRKAVLRLGNSDQYEPAAIRTLVFNSPTGGELYNSDSGGSFKIGTFTVPE